MAKKKVAKKVAKAEKAETNLISLKELAKEAELSPGSARARLREAEVKREGRWAWPEGSSGLKQARKALDL